MKHAPLLLILILTNLVHGQIKHPQASPLAIVQQEVGLTKLMVHYSRPATQGRTIFGDLVPYGRIWRVGANASTKFSSTDDVEIMGQVLLRGTYALYAFPEEDAWQVVFHKNLTHWGDGRTAYDPNEDALRVKVPVERSATFQENFLISFDSITHNSAMMIWHWAYTKIKIPLHLDTDAKMQQEIQEQLKQNPTAQTYYEAARFLQEQDRDHAVALSYLNKALVLGGDTYYFHRVKAMVEAAMEDYGSAIRSAEKSLELAAKEGKDEFVRMNQKNIDLWKSKRN